MGFLHYIKEGGKTHTRTPYTHQITTFLYDHICLGIRSLSTLSSIPLRGASFDMVLDEYMKLKYLNLWRHWLLSVLNVEFVLVSHNPTCKYVSILCWRRDDRNDHSCTHRFPSYKSHVTTIIMVIYIANWIRNKITES